MVEFFETLDKSVVLTINSWNSPFMDEFMWWVSAKITWIPLYLLLVYLAYCKIGLKSAVLFLVFVVLTIVLADAISVYALKEVVQRYRPSHNLSIKDSLHLYQISKTDFYSGGLYGFVSSHATNFTVIVTCFFYVFYKEYKTMCYFLIAFVLLICYSRIYLAVHYLTDVLGGIILGFLFASISFKLLWKKLN